MAAHLWASEPSALSFATSAQARGYLDKTEPIHISTTNNARTPAPWIVVHRNDSALPPEIVKAGALPLTSARRTVLDMAGIGHRKTEWVLDTAIRKKETSIADIAFMLEERRMRGRRGVARLGRMIEARDPSLAPTDSEMEDLALGYLRAAGVELPRTQWPVTIPTGNVRLDLAWPDLMFQVELDSAAWHLTLEAEERDNLRDEQLGMLGWYIVRVTATRLVKDPVGFVEMVRHHVSTRRSLLAG